MQLFANNASTLLAADLTNEATTIAVQDASVFPVLSLGGYYLLTLVEEGANSIETDWEVLKVTDASENTLTVLRAQEGTTAKCWPSGAKIELRLTAGSLDTLRQWDSIRNKPTTLNGFGITDATAENVGADPEGTAISVMTGHTSDPDAHPQYVSEQDVLGAINSHEAATDPHPQYATAAEAATAIAAAKSEAIAASAPAGHTHDYAALTSKPTLGTSAALNVPASGNAAAGEVVKGSDTRLTDARPASDVSAWAKAASKPSYTSDETSEGVTNKYFTEGRVLAAVLTGLSIASSAAVLATDTVLSAFGKLQAQINARQTIAAADTVYTFPTVRPSLILDFANSRQVDPRISFSRPVPATYYGADGRLKTALAGVPRIDFDPATGVCKGLLIEEGRTNLLTYSEQFDDATWPKTRASVTANAAIAPDGTLTADKLVEDATASNNHNIVRSVAAISSTTYTYSVFLKAAERGFALVQLGNVANQVASNPVSVDLTTGAFTSNDATRTKVENAGGGWWRVSTTVTTTASGTSISPSIYVCATMGGSVYTGDGTSGIYVWGAQLEVGSFPTSYIPTTTAAVTRAADVATLSGANFSSWYRQDEGTFVYVGDDATVVNTVQFTVSDGTQNERIFLNTTSTGVVRLSVLDDGVTHVTQVGNYTISPSAQYKAAVAYKANDFAVVGGGAVVGVDTNGTLPVVDRLVLHAAYNNTYQYSGHVSRLVYFPKRLTNAELQAVTA